MLTDELNFILLLHSTQTVPEYYINCTRVIAVRVTDCIETACLRLASFHQSK